MMIQETIFKRIHHHPMIHYFSKLFDFIFVFFKLFSFRQLAESYSYYHLKMKSPKKACSTDVFPEGITNGAAW